MTQTTAYKIPTHLLLRYFITNDDKMETLVFCRSSEMNLVVSTEELYSALGCINEKDNFSLGKLTKLLEVVTVRGGKPSKVLSHEDVETIRKKSTGGDKMTDENVNMSIVEGDAFFAHEVSVNYNPLQFILDFKCVTPRIDPRSKSKASIHMKHNVVLMDPFHLKRVHGMIGDVISKYEKEFGEIEKPKALEKVAKKPKGDKAKANIPEYFG